MTDPRECETAEMEDFTWNQEAEGRVTVITDLRPMTSTDNSLKNKLTNKNPHYFIRNIFSHVEQEIPGDGRHSWEKHRLLCQSRTNELSSKSNK